MRYFVTGATGHLGRAVVSQLLESGNDVAALVRSETKAAELCDSIGAAANRLTTIAGDLNSHRPWPSVVENYAPTAVIHCAWSGVAANNRDDAAAQEANVTTTERLLQLTANCGAAVFVGIGSQAEYGAYCQALHEELPEHPETAYGQAKLRAGQLARSYCESHGIRGVWLRLLATYGPLDDPAHLIPYLIVQALARAPAALRSPSARWDYLYVRDAARAIQACAESDSARGVYNLGSGEAKTVREIAETIQRLVRPDSAPMIEERESSSADVMNLVTSIEKLRRATGWQPETSLEDGLRKTIEWYHRHAANAGESRPQ